MSHVILHYSTNMHHGRGEEYWMTKTYEKYRRLALEWRFRFSEDELEELGVSPPQGDGRYYKLANEITQFPFPMGPSRSPRRVNSRYHPRVG